MKKNKSKTTPILKKSAPMLEGVSYRLEKIRESVRTHSKPLKLKMTKISFDIDKTKIGGVLALFERHIVTIITLVLSLISVYFFVFYLKNGLGLSYNDARSHLDIGRRVVEGLKPGLAQLGSVWLPLNHILMIPLVWNDWAWHSGFAGAIWNMLSFVATGLIIYKILEKLNVGMLGRIIGIIVFVANLNILYLQSTAMTEPLLLATMTAGCYYLISWAEDRTILSLVKSSFWIMLSTLVRYDGWFLLVFAAAIVGIINWKDRGYKVAEGLTILFLTMGALGIVLWFGWNAAIFKDPLYFALGPYSAHAQQLQLLQAGNLPTKNNVVLSTQLYLYSVLYNCIAFVAILGFLGGFFLWFDKKIKGAVRLSTLTLIAPIAFNILALVLGFSVLFVQGISGNTWFNIRYGIMMMPAFAVFIGYIIGKLKDLRWVLVGLYIFVMFFAFANGDAVTIDDARVGSSQKNVSEISGYLNRAAKDQPGFILISAASHDAIIFSSGLPMSRFIHEGTGEYWKDALIEPDRWARWIVMRTYDNNDQSYKGVSKSSGFKKYHLVESYPFADVYEIDSQYLTQLNYTPVLGKQK
jgi:hypothetical protein